MLTFNKQYNAYQNTSKIEDKNVFCCVPILGESILGPLLFLVYINDLWHSTPLLEVLTFFIRIIMLKSYLEL